LGTLHPALWDGGGSAETSMMGLHYGQEKKFNTISLTVWIQHTNVIDGRRDADTGQQLVYALTHTVAR